MARNKLEKLGILKLVACVLIGGTLMFTFTACGKTDAPVESPVAIEQVETVVEEDNDVAEVDLIENADDIGNGTEAEQTETYKVEFKYCQNEEIEAKTDEKVTIPEYEDVKLMDTYYSEKYFSIDNEEYFKENFEVISEEDSTIIARATTLEITDGMVTRYSYDEDNMKAIFCYQPYLEGTDQEITAEDFGLNFVIEKDAEENYKVVGLQDLAGNRCDDIIFYYGDVIGWSLTENAELVDFEFGDEIYLSQDLTLYPVVENMVNPEMENVDQGAGLWIKSFAGRVVQYSKTGKGRQSENGWYSKGGKVVSEDGKKEYNPDSKKVEDSEKVKEEKAKEEKKKDEKPAESTTPKAPSQPSQPTQPSSPDPGTTENNPDPWGVPDVNAGGDYMVTGESWADTPNW